MATFVTVHPRMPSISVDIAWTNDPNTAPGSLTWVSASTYLREYSLRLYRQSELDEFQTGQFVVRLDNRDRRFEPLYAAGPYYPNVIPRRRIRIQAQWNGVTYDRVGGFIQQIVPQWPEQKDGEVIITAADYGLALNRATVTIDGYPEELAHLRIGRVLDAIGVPSADRNLDTSDHTISAVPAAADPNQPTVVGALEHCRQVAQSDGGYVFVSRDGKITFHDRVHRKGLSNSGTFGDSTGEMAYLPNLVPSMDDSRLWNQSSVLTYDGTRETTTDTTSQTKYWPARRDDFQSLLSRPGEAAAIASLFVWRYKDAQLRFPQVQIAPESSHYSNAQMAVIMAADLGTKFTLKRRPQGGTAISQDVHVEGITEDVVPGLWSLGFDVSPADSSSSFWSLGTSALNSTAIVGF